MIMPMTHTFALILTSTCCSCEMAVPHESAEDSFGMPQACLPEATDVIELWCRLKGERTYEAWNPFLVWPRSSDTTLWLISSM